MEAKTLAHGRIEHFIPPRHIKAFLMSSHDEAEVATAYLSLKNGYTEQHSVSLRVSSPEHVFHFDILLESDLDAHELVDPEFSLRIETCTSGSIELSINPLLRSAIEFGHGSALICRAMRPLSPKATEAMAQRSVHYATRLELQVTHPLLVSRLNGDIGTAGQSTGALEQFSTVLLPVGLRSTDGAAIIGRDGYFYVVGGSNDIDAMFVSGMKPERLQRLLRAWLLTLKSRQDATLALGCKYVQVIVPEKITALPAFFPLDVISPSELLWELENSLLGDPSMFPHYISGLEIIKRKPATAIYRKIDSHLTPTGAYLFAAQIARSLGFDPPKIESFDAVVISAGDLGAKYFGYPLYEKYSTLDPTPKLATARQVVERFIPEGGGHIGRRTVIKNLIAPFSATVLVFGNSFMDSHMEQWSISYWLSSWFQNFTFVFSPSIDLDYIESLKPTAVIAQTIERYLGHVPRS